MLTFDPDKHEYRFNGALVPSVTQVIKSAACIADGEVKRMMPDYRALGGDLPAELGRAVHEATVYIDHHQLDWNDLDERIVGYCRSYETWLKLGIEWRGVLDIKTGSRADWHGVQLAAYAELAHWAEWKWGVGREVVAYYPANRFAGTIDRANTGWGAARYSLYLDSDGGPAKLVEWPRENYVRDFAAFLAALNLGRYMGVLP